MKVDCLYALVIVCVGLVSCSDVAPTDSSNANSISNNDSQSSDKNETSGNIYLYF